MTSADLYNLVQTYGLSLLFPLSVLEGPIVTVLAGFLARQELLPLGWAFGVLVAGDLTGDALHYALGRSGLRILPERWQRRCHATPDQIAPMVAHFAQKGGRTLFVAKITHSLGFAALVAAGAARMPFGSFLFFNLLGTLPKTAALLALGYVFGRTDQGLAHLVFVATLVGFAICLALLLRMFLKHRCKT
ncbi:SNARE associated Golgi protein [Aquimixticola soesokkakensis]|uniref:SNARE associated Golgi protein n=1 Tax=Aquimixticola soesokkakensis TaxID=1519096 RepID=A0A1Y5SUE6_9RHOB|nr:VTT domain-containing protein [Aquimixticola soesokkakensis]SLN48309.1 SNARE associated Golgi protein [Aquimixticola soesokkakensis]